MKSFKIPSTSSLFISKQSPTSNFKHANYIPTGQYEDAEFRGLLEFKINPKIFEFKITRADLIIYLDDVKINSNIESFMLNIARNIDLFDSNTVNWCNAPKFFQGAYFSKIETTYAKNCIIIDITKLLEYWMKNKIYTFGLTLLGLTQSSLIYIANAQRNKPLLEIFLDNDHSSKPHNHNSSNAHYTYTTKTCNNPQIMNPSNTICDTQNYYTNQQNIDCFTPNYEYKEQKICYDTLINENNNDTSFSNSPLSTQIACGNFISNNGNLLISNSIAYVKFDTENNALRTNLNINSDGIFILTKGLYKIDYFINCRSEPFSTVELELDGISLPFTKVQISSSDSPTSSSTIIDVPEDNMILKLKISTSNSILINTGICASLTLVKIN